VIGSIVIGSIETGSIVIGSIVIGSIVNRKYCESEVLSIRKYCRFGSIVNRKYCRVAVFSLQYLKIMSFMNRAKKLAIYINFISQKLDCINEL
jgi:hypothetical protein